MLFRANSCKFFRGFSAPFSLLSGVLRLPLVDETPAAAAEEHLREDVVGAYPVVVAARLPVIDFVGVTLRVIPDDGARLLVPQDVHDPVEDGAGEFVPEDDDIAHVNVEDLAVAELLLIVRVEVRHGGLHRPPAGVLLLVVYPRARALHDLVSRRPVYD